MEKTPQEYANDLVEKYFTLVPASYYLAPQLALIDVQNSLDLATEMHNEILSLSDSLSLYTLKKVAYFQEVKTILTNL